MRTRIRCAALSLAMAATTLTVVSCKPDSTAPIDPPAVAGATILGKTSQSPAEQAAWIGKYHNDALAFALIRIKQSRSSSRFGRCKTGLAALKEFQKAFRKSGGSVTFDDLSLTDGMCEAAEAANGGVARNVAVAGSGLTPRRDISAPAGGYMNQVESAVDAMTSVPGLTATVNSIDNSAAASLPGLEAAAVAGTGSIAVSSAEYWTTSGGGWNGGTQLAYSKTSGSTGAAIVGAPPTGGPRYDISARTRRIIKADVSAFIGVMVYEWWTGEVGVAKACIKAAAASLIAGVYLY
jgi:hypothetical protein